MIHDRVEDVVSVHRVRALCYASGAPLEEEPVVASRIVVGGGSRRRNDEAPFTVSMISWT